MGQRSLLHYLKSKTIRIFTFEFSKKNERESLWFVALLL